MERDIMIYMPIEESEELFDSLELKDMYDLYDDHPMDILYEYPEEYGRFDRCQKLWRVK